MNVLSWHEGLADSLVLHAQLETNERVVYDKKRKLKQAIESGKPIPTELREEEAELRHQIEMDDAQTEEVHAWAWS